MQYELKQITREQRDLCDEMIDMGFPHIIAHALALRNFEILEEPYHYDLLTDLNKGVDFIFQQLLNNGKICIVADYDADGATSCAIMVKGLKKLVPTCHVSYFLPDRQIHGYGLQSSVIDDLLLSFPETEIIITVDNGISAIAGVEYAHEKGLKVLITDHHIEGDNRPQNTIGLINPNRKDCQFPSKALAGCGVAYYFIHALHQKFIQESKSNSYSEIEKKIIQYAKNISIDDLLCYMAIGTVADVVPLDANNRHFIQLGMDLIRDGNMPVGVRALLGMYQFNDDNFYKFNTEDIAFKIAPTLNAIGRLEDMTMGVRMLLSDDYYEANELAMTALSLNNQRKDIEKSMVQDAEYIIQNGCESKLDSNYGFSSAILLDEGHEGVVGIVASRIKDKIYRPAIVFIRVHEKHNGKKLIKGSGRSIAGVHIRDAIDYVTKKDPNIVVKFGGHAMAAGLSIYEDKLDDFKRYFDEYCAESLNHIYPSLIYQVDEDLDLSEINLDDIRFLNQLTWGQHFPKPIYVGNFLIHEQRLLNDKKTGQPAHLKLKVEKDGQCLDAIWFRKNKVFESDRITLIYSLSINEWLGNESIQIMVIDGTEYRHHYL